MSIIIQGIEMPKVCFDCPCCDWEQDCCNITKKPVGLYDETRQEDCPLKEAEPVIHAHWIKDKRKMREDGEIYDYCCSQCKGEAIESQYGNHDVFTDYCPHCGAKMDEDE